MYYARINEDVRNICPTCCTGQHNTLILFTCPEKTTPLTPEDFWLQHAKVSEVLQSLKHHTYVGPQNNADNNPCELGELWEVVSLYEYRAYAKATNKTPFGLHLNFILNYSISTNKTKLN